MGPQSTFYIAAGALFSSAWFVFFDGMIIAKSIGKPYQFLMWLPCLLSLCGSFAMGLANPQHIFTDGDDMIAFDDSVEEQRSKVFFFIGSLLLLGGLTISVWRMIDPYSNSGDSWPGVAIVLQNTLLAAFAGVLLLARSKRESEYGF